MSTPQIKTKRVTVTPRMAEKWLVGNTHNRSLRAQAVAHYVADLESGRWQFTGDAIRITADGTIIDGAHRLHAVVRAGVPMDTLVITGLPMGVQSVIDTGTPRSLGDALRLTRGVEKYQTNVAAVVRWCMQYESEALNDSGHYRITTTAALEWYDEHPWAYECAAWATGVKTRGAIPLIGISLMGGLRALSPDDDEVVAFFAAVETGADLREGDPRLALRRWLDRRAASNLGTGRKALATVTINAYNAYLRGDSVKALRYQPGSALPQFATLDEVAA